MDECQFCIRGEEPGHLHQPHTPETAMFWERYYIQDDEQPGIQIAVWVCDVCGALVRDQEKHMEFHNA